MSNKFDEKSSRMIGDFQIECMVPLTEQEKIEFGREQSDALIQIEKLEADKKDAMADFKKQIDELHVTATGYAHIIRAGQREVIRDTVCYVDFKREQRVYVDKITGEIVKECSMQPEDRQLSMM